jgi:hypothetical protein
MARLSPSIASAMPPRTAFLPTTSEPPRHKRSRPVSIRRCGKRVFSWKIRQLLSVGSAGTEANLQPSEPQTGRDPSSKLPAVSG